MSNEFLEDTIARRKAVIVRGAGYHAARGSRNPDSHVVGEHGAQ
jgi:hypothetical protein